MQKCKNLKEFWYCNNLWQSWIWRRHFLQHPRTMPPNHLPQGYSPLGSALNCSSPHMTQTKTDFEKSFWEKILFTRWVNKALCVVASRNGEHTPSRRASDSGISEKRRPSLSECRKINSFPRQLNSHISFAHTFLQKYQNGKALSSSKNLRACHRTNSNRNGGVFSSCTLMHASLLKWGEKNYSKSSSSGSFWLIRSYKINI